MKRNTQVAKPNRGEQEPFSRQLHLARKESLRLRIENSERIEGLKRKHARELDAAHENLNKALADYDRERVDFNQYRALHENFARVAPALRSRSFLRRLWWGIRFGLWGVFRFEN